MAGCQQLQSQVERRVAWREQPGSRELSAGAGGWRGMWDCGGCCEQQAGGVMQPPGGKFLGTEPPVCVPPWPPPISYSIFNSHPTAQPVPNSEAVPFFPIASVLIFKQLPLPPALFQQTDASSCGRETSGSASCWEFGVESQIGNRRRGCLLPGLGWGDCNVATVRGRIPAQSWKKQRVEMILARRSSLFLSLRCI